jgi:hypothetical protein
MSIKRVFYILLVFWALQSCDDNPMPGGRCAYNEFPGTALFREVIPDTLNETCSNAMFVYYDFLPDDPNAPDKYEFPSFSDTNQTFRLSGYHPPASWLAAQGIEVGSEFPCIRNEITSGTCEPYTFQFPTIEGSHWREYCEPRNILVGEWEYWFVATNPITCPVEPVPVGCGGGGVLRFYQSGTSLRCSYTLRAGCQNCGSAWDYGGSGTIEDLDVSGNEVRFSMIGCRFTALLPEQPVDQIDGDVTCTNPESKGSWRMTRKM